MKKQRLILAVSTISLITSCVGLGRGLASFAEQRQADVASGLPAPKVDAPDELFSGPPHVSVEHKSAVTHIAWSHDCRRLATSTAFSGIYILDVASGKAIRSSLAEDRVGPISFSPDGKTVAVADDGRTVTVWDVGTGNQQRQFGGAGSNVIVEHIAFTSDGSFIIGVGVGGIYRWGYGMGVSTMVTTPGSAAIAPDGSTAGWVTAGGSCYLFRYRAEDPNNPIAGPAILKVGPATCVAFGPHSKQFAVSGQEKEVQVWDVATKAPTAKLLGLNMPATGLAFSADGKTLAAVSGDGRSIFVWDLTRNTVRCRINHKQGDVGLLALSPDGKKLATTAKYGKVFYVWTTKAHLVDATSPPLEVSENELAALWVELSNPAFERADAAWRKLAAAGDNAITFLRQQIRPLATLTPDMKKIEKLVAELDSGKFAIRD
jgi:WD40 repeat protein